MTAVAHTGWHRQTRNYRIRHRLIIVAEAIGVALMLAPVAFWGATMVALSWLTLRLANRPSDHQLAALIEEKFPQLADMAVPMVELTTSRDSDAVKGSRDLIQSHARDVEKLLQSIDLRSLVPVKPLLGILAAAFLVNLGSILRSNNTDATGIAQSPPPSQGQAAQAARRAPGPEQRLDQLQALQDQLRLLPSQILRQLPAHTRSLENALQDARQALQDRANREWTEAAERETNVTDNLAELARVAASMPELQALANQAASLAREYADAATSAGSKIAGTTGLPGSDLAGGSAPDQSPRGMLPSKAAGQGRWVADTEKLHDNAVVRLGLYPQDYAPRIVDHFGQLATP